MRAPCGGQLHDAGGPRLPRPQIHLQNGRSRSLCATGCTGTVCSVRVSDTVSEFLNFPDLNLLMCGLLADCGNAAYTEGAAGAQVPPNVRV